jgi:hypothetical protein
MPVPLYLDVHVPLAIAEQLRRRGVDVVHAVEKGSNRLEGGDLLEIARAQGRVMVTQDIRFRVLAKDWQRRRRPFAGLFYGHQLATGIGRWVADLELIASASDAVEWENAVRHLPL